MNINDLRELQLNFDKISDDIQQDYKIVDRLRIKFVKDFSLKKLKELKIDDYVIGLKHSSFCCRLENELNEWGNIHGSTAWKFGVYFGKSGNDKEKKYRYAYKFGNNLKESFNNVKQSVIDLIQAGEKEDYQSIVNNLISPMFKGKILSIYYPNKFLNIYSATHLNYFINSLSLANKSKSEIEKQRILINFKNNDIVMKSWTVYKYTRFLYYSFDKPMNPRKSVNPKLKKYLLKDFPPIEDVQCEYVNYDLDKYMNHTNSNNSSKQDYSEKNKNAKRIGNRGEQVVLIAEKTKLINVRRIDLSEKINHISESDDGAGYDIQSFDTDGNEIYIEVKATIKKMGKNNFFISHNEYQLSLDKDNYFIYYVFEVNTKSPKIWILNPKTFFNDSNVNISPIKYRIDFNVV